MSKFISYFVTNDILVEVLYIDLPRGRAVKIGSAPV